MARWLVVMLLLGSGLAHAEAPEVSLLPIRSKWASTGEIVRIGDVVTELAGELGIEIRRLDGDAESCFGDAECYVNAARSSGATTVLALEVIKTSSGRFHLSFRLIDAASNALQTFPLVRSPPGVLRAQLRATIAAVRDALPRPQVKLPSPPPPIPVPEPPPPPAPDATPVPTPWYQSISINAFASVAYTYNLNRPPTATNALRVFDVEHGSATIDVAELVIQRGTTEPGEAGFRIDLVAGSAIPHLSASAGLFRDADGKAEDFDLQQAFATYVAPVGRGLKIDAGKFASPAGAEVIEGYDGFGDHYSRSLLFGFAVPFTHTGLRVGYSFNDRITLTGFGINGWDVVRDNNRAKSFGAQIAILPATDLAIAATYLGGAENPDDTKTLRHLGDLVVTYKPVQRIALTVNLDYAKDGATRWYGAAGYLRVDLADRIAVGVRGEQFSDPDGARTGVAQDVWESTITGSFGLARGLTFRVEMRYDRSNERVFPARTGDRLFQLTGAANAVYAL